MSVFIDKIAEYVKKYAKDYGIQVHSPIIAQAILESSSGTSELATNANNYFGLKYNPSQPNRCPSACGHYVKAGSEQNKDGSYTQSSMLWQKFPNMEAGVKGYFEFINYSNRYNNLKGVTDPRKYLELIKADGYATSLNYVNNVYNVIIKYNLTQYDNIKEEKSMVDCVVKSPNHSGKRTHAIDRITPHCVVGQLSAESIGQCFVKSSRQASCNYGIGYDGRVVLVVDEDCRSWCSSSSANDQRAVTIEVASDKTHPYAFKDAAYNKLIDLCVDICKRNNKNTLIWISDKDKALAYSPKPNEMLLTVHRWFKNKACPGDWMMARMGDLAEKVTSKLGNTPSQETIEEVNEVNTKPSTTTTTTPKEEKVLYRVQVGAYKLKSNAELKLNNIKKAGFSDAFITQVNGLYKVQVGAYSVKANAEAQLQKVKAKGFEGFIAEEKNGVTISSKAPYIVQVTASSLNIRKGPGTNYAITGAIKNNGLYTIVEEQDGWGKLLSGAGWIKLSYTVKK